MTVKKEVAGQHTDTVSIDPLHGWSHLERVTGHCVYDVNFDLRCYCKVCDRGTRLVIRPHHGEGDEQADQLSRDYFLWVFK